MHRAAEHPTEMIAQPRRRHAQQQALPTYEACIKRLGDVQQLMREYAEMFGNPTLWMHQIANLDMLCHMPPDLTEATLDVVRRVEQISTNAGHWMQCRNGHISAIGQCRAAIKTMQCPECRVPIG
jgi:hypothetical protein